MSDVSDEEGNNSTHPQSENEVEPSKGADNSVENSTTEGLVEKTILQSFKDLNFQFRYLGDSWRQALEFKDVEGAKICEIAGHIDTNPRPEGGRDIIELEIHLGFHAALAHTFRVGKGVKRIDFIMRAEWNEPNLDCLTVNMKSYGPLCSYCNVVLESIELMRMANVPRDVIPVQICETSVIIDETVKTEPRLEIDVSEEQAKTLRVVDVFSSTQLTGKIVGYLRVTDIGRLASTCKWIRYILSDVDTWSRVIGRSLDSEFQKVPQLKDVPKWMTLWWCAALYVNPVWLMERNDSEGGFDPTELVKIRTDEMRKMVAPEISEFDDQTTTKKQDPEPEGQELWVKSDNSEDLDGTIQYKLKNFRKLPLTTNLRKYLTCRIMVVSFVSNVNEVIITTHRRPKFAPLSISRLGSSPRSLSRTFRLYDDPGEPFVAWGKFPNSDRLLHIKRHPKIQFFWTST